MPATRVQPSRPARTGTAQATRPRVVTLLALAAAGCGVANLDTGGPGPGGDSVDTASCTPSGGAVSLSLGTLLPVDAQGVFARAVRRDSGFTLYYGLGSVYFYQAFDEAWVAQGSEGQLTPDGESERDHAVAFDDTYTFHLASVRGADGDPPSMSLAKFGADHARVGDGLTYAVDGPSIDPVLAVVDGEVLAGTEHRGEGTWNGNMPPDDEVERALAVRVYDADLALSREVVLLADVAGAAAPRQYWGLGSALVEAEGYRVLFAASAIGDTSNFADGESVGARQIFALRFDADLEFVDAFGPLTDTTHDNYWSTGAVFDGGHYFVAHTYRRPEDGSVPMRDSGGVETDAANVRLEVYDRCFNPVDSLAITDFAPEEIDVGQGAHRAGLLAVADRLYVTYDDGMARVREVLVSR